MKNEYDIGIHGVPAIRTAHIESDQQGLNFLSLQFVRFLSEVDNISRGQKWTLNPYQNYVWRMSTTLVDTGLFVHL